MGPDELETIKEVSKAWGTTVEALQQFGRFLSEILGPAFKELGEVATGWAHYIRLKNGIMIQDKWEAIIRRRRIEGKTVPIPSRYAIPLIQNAVEEDNETIQNMWVGLIANWTDPDKKFTPRKIFIQILSALEPLDAKILQFFPTQGWKVFKEIPEGGITLDKLRTALGTTEKEIQLSLENLARLGCIVDEQGPIHWGQNISSAFGKTISNPNTIFKISPLGNELLNVCQAIEFEKQK